MGSYKVGIWGDMVHSKRTIIRVKAKSKAEAKQRAVDIYGFDRDPFVFS